MASAAPITAVLFDLDDTLNDRGKSWVLFIERLLGEFTSRMATDDRELILQVILTADQGGYRPKHEFFADVATRLPWIDQLSTDKLESFWRTTFASCTVERCGARELSVDLRSAGLQVGIVTNGRTDMQQAKIRALGFENLIDALIISDSVGVKKPNAGIYSEAMRSLTCASDHVLFVGDNPLRDVAGPASIGMHTAWLSLGRSWPAEHRPPDYVLKSLEDLREILAL